MTRNPQQIIIWILNTEYIWILNTEVHNAALVVMVLTTVLQFLHFLSVGGYLRENVGDVCMFALWDVCKVCGFMFPLRLVRICVRLANETCLVVVANRCFFVDDSL